ncbi:MAG: hypothetical protein ACFE8O_00070 [Candidatus Hermodarchaeota archaeon]
MLYVVETPLLFGLVIIICILTLLISIMTLIVTLKTEGTSTAGYNLFLAAFFAFLTFMVLAISMYTLPAAATVDQLLPTYLGAWSFIGLHSLFLVIYFLGIPFFKRRIWAIFLPIIGTLSYLALVWILPSPATVTIVSDGAMNFIAMPITLVAYAGFLAIIYFLVIPLFALYKVAQSRQGMAKTWTWIAMLGEILWFTGLILMALVQYTALYMLFIYGIIVIAAILILLSIYFVIVTS